MRQKIILTVIMLLVFLVGADLLGVGVCFLGACGFINGWTKAAAYTLWGVFGIFVGFFQYFIVGEGEPTPEPLAKAGPPSKWSFLLVFVVTAAVLGILTWIFYQTGWRRGVDSEDMYVPDSMSATLTLFISILAMMLFSMCLGMPVSYPVPKKAAATGDVGGNRQAASRKAPPSRRKLT